jgi:hypothetical protein
MLRSFLVSSMALGLPPVAIGFAYSKYLGHRSDYLGHFLAGFGGTLGAVAAAIIALALIAAVRSTSGRFGVPSTTGWLTLLVVLACIGLGAIFEETLYHIAKWDEVDFCNQSLGAVIAGLAALAALGGGPRSASDPGTLSNLVPPLAMGLWGAVVLAGGYYFAFR